MFFDLYAEHLRDSASDNSRWDGFDRGDTDNDEIDTGSVVVGRMTAAWGGKVEIINHWHQDDELFEVVAATASETFEYRSDAVAIARQWLKICPV